MPWHVSRAPRGTLPLGAEGGWELGELEARVHADGVAQLLPQDALLAVVGQLEQVEAGGGGGQAATWLPLADGKEATQDAAQGVASVLQAHPTASGWGAPGERAGPAPCGGQPAWRGGCTEASLAPGVLHGGSLHEAALGNRTSGLTANHR